LARNTFARLLSLNKYLLCLLRHCIASFFTTPVGTVRCTCG
jgi:hypothetical protein